MAPPVPLSFPLPWNWPLYFRPLLADGTVRPMHYQEALAYHWHVAVRQTPDMWPGEIEQYAAELRRQDTMHAATFCFGDIPLTNLIP